MIRVWIPTPLRPVCGGADTLDVEGATLGEVLRNVDQRCPGFYDRVVEDDHVRGQLAIALNGSVEPYPLHWSIEDGAELAIVPALGGG